MKRFIIIRFYVSVAYVVSNFYNNIKVLLSDTKFAMAEVN